MKKALLKCIAASVAALTLLGAVTVIILKSPKKKSSFTESEETTVTALYTIDLANTNKVKKQEAEKEAAYQQQIDDLQYEIDFLKDQLQIEIPPRETEEEAE